MIKDGLCLDHFYVSFSPKEIKELKFLTKSLSRCVYRRVRSGNSSWAGIYPGSNIGSYFEMIAHGPGITPLGIAASSANLQYLDARKIRSEMPHLPWMKGKRLWKKTKKTWFEWVGLKARKGTSLEEDGITTWIMHYGQIHDPKRNKVSQASIDRFSRLVVEMGENYRDSLKYHTQWLPGSHTFLKKSGLIEIPDRDRGTFLIEIKFRPGKSPSRLLQLDAQLCPSIKTKPERSDGFKMLVTRDKLSLMPV